MSNLKERQIVSEDILVGEGSQIFFYRVEKAMEILNSFRKTLALKNIRAVIYWEKDEYVLEWVDNNIHSTFAINISTEESYFLSFGESGNLGDEDFSSLEDIQNRGADFI